MSMSYKKLLLKTVYTIVPYSRDFVCYYLATRPVVLTRFLSCHHALQARGTGSTASLWLLVVHILFRGLFFLFPACIYTSITRFRESF